MDTTATGTLRHLASLADATRSRLLLLLDGSELTVSELCAILQLPQSTVSRHLKALSDDAWISVRAEGTSRLYTMKTAALAPSAGRLWQLVREQVAETPAAARDRRRLRGTLAQRRSTSQQFFSSAAGHWDRVREELFGDRFHLAALAALAPGDGVVGDLGCGTGQVTAALAPFVSRVVSVDESAEMLRAAKTRLDGITNVDLRRGELEALPIDDNRLDVATLMVVLHHVAEPEAAMAEVARVLKPGGRVVVVDMQPHDREAYRQSMGHIWLGFSSHAVAGLLEAGGFDAVKVVPLPPDRRAMGPELFVATGTKKAA
jgi:ArsR family transcriptional regulator